MVTTNEPTDSAQTRTILNVTDSDSPFDLSRHQCPALVHNQGAGGKTVINLPTDAMGGEEVEGVVLAAQDLAFDPGSGNRIIGSDGGSFSFLAAGAQVIGDAAGETIKLVCLGPDSNGNVEWLATRQHDNAPGTAGNFNEEN